MKQAKRRKWLWISAVLGILAVLFCLEVYRSSHQLTTAHYEVHNDKLTAPVRVVQLTDLHNACFGSENTHLLTRVSEAAPDLILFTGDLVTAHVEETDTARALWEQLTQIAPVYVSIGNHEQMHEQNYGSDLTALYEQTGASVLEYEWEDIDVNGQSLRIGGTSGYSVPEKYLSTGEADPEECAFLNHFQDTDRCTLLMNHIPVCWIQNDGIGCWDCDLVFSGHAHGGQVILPGIGGLYAPDMGFFPGRMEGLFSSSDGKNVLVLSSGLGSAAPIPRFNNPPQILILDILP